MANKSEYQLQKNCSEWLKIQYPDVYFISDPDGLKLPIGQSVKLKNTRSNHKHLDMIILEPNYYYSGMVVEFKKSADDYLLKNGCYSNKKHIKEQRQTAIELIKKNYYVTFCHDFDDFVKQFSKYMEGWYYEFDWVA